MKVKATSAGRKVDLYDACSRVTLTAKSADEAAFLAALVGSITHGGEIEIRPADGKVFVIGYPTKEPV
jgi:hypothetical protein